MTIRRILLVSGIIILLVSAACSNILTWEGVRTEDVKFLGAGNISLSGKIFLPPYATSSAVIVLHGLGAQKENMYPICIELARHGYAALAYDFRGHGKSEGECTLASLEVEDLKKAVSLMDKFEHIGVVGHSHGAMTAMIEASSDPRVESVVAIGGPPSIQSLIEKYRLPPAMIGSMHEKARKFFGTSLNLLSEEEARKRSPIYYVNESFGANLLVMVGDVDELVSIQDALAIVNSSGGINVSEGAFKERMARGLIILPSTTHALEIFNPLTPVKVIEWFDRSFGVNREVRCRFAEVGAIMGIGLLGLLILFFPLTSYLGKYEKIGTEVKLRYLAAYPLALCAAAIFIIPSPLRIAGNKIITTFLGSALIPLICISIPIRQRIKVSIIHEFPRAVLIGLLIPALSIASLIAITAGALFNPIPSLEFWMVMPMIFPVILLDEAWIRIIQDRLAAYGKWEEFFLSPIAIGIFKMLSVIPAVISFSAFLGIPMDIVPGLVSAFSVGFGVGFFIYNIFLCWVYQRTRNVLSTSLGRTVLASYALCMWSSFIL